MNYYENEVIATQFLDFLKSTNGTIQQEILLKYLLPRLPINGDATILDAACGNGWLSGALALKYHDVQAFDSSPTLIKAGQQKFPDITFIIANASGELPYRPEQFDCVILNMAAHDLENQPKAFENFYKLLKPEGKLLVTMANPYYSYPVGIWKRGWIGAILRRKPQLKIRPYNWFRNLANRSFQWNKKMTSLFYPLSEHVTNIISSGFILTAYQDLQTENDSQKFNATYQLNRFPILLLLEFKKPSK